MQMPKCRDVAVGRRVGADHRDPPEHRPWLGKPHKGTLLAQDDPRAWEGSLAFDGRRPSRQEVRDHLAQLAARGIRIKDVPVAWDFGKIYWELADTLYLVRPSRLTKVEAPCPPSSASATFCLSSPQPPTCPSSRTRAGGT